MRAGDQLFIITHEDQGFEVVAFVPGQFRPLLHVGQSLKLSLTGYPHVFAALPVTSVGDQVMGQSEARRFLGPELSDAVPIEGPSVLIRAPLRGLTFVSDGETHEYFHGLQGRGEVIIRTQPLILTVFPGLRPALERKGG
ncbi:MAG: hypothetical protein E6K80_08220 [Candidatus Eisenbacteria bacterium]|uniref:Uncharacterized protein n=1 Tax=Eiseniibacteriota bacterium TaxID=2212470 RepID=A0A538U3R6_UNCEI|nr:MAG: hypothetical protein E6K80_08220 [Candidatus Eisenbacteria bacterium]